MSDGRGVDWAAVAATYWPAVTGAVGAVWFWWTRRGAEQITRDEARARGAESSVATAHQVVALLADRLAAVEADAVSCQERIAALRAMLEVEQDRSARMRRDLADITGWVREVVTEWGRVRHLPDPPTPPMLDELHLPGGQDGT